MDYVKVTANGLDEIADGRVFVIAKGLQLDAPDFSLTTPVKRVEPISPVSPMGCSECGEPLQRFLIAHDYLWMYTAFGCAGHPHLAAYLDIFPKVDGGTEHDWVNSFMGMDTGRERFIGIVEPITWPDEQQSWYLGRARSEAELTPDGLRYATSPLRPKGWKVTPLGIITALLSCVLAVLPILVLIFGRMGSNAIAIAILLAVYFWPPLAYSTRLAFKHKELPRIVGGPSFLRPGKPHRFVPPNG
ncbi:MAG: hypothetical protein WD603_01330 [Patescibacteria group bacterium]